MSFLEVRAYTLRSRARESLRGNFFQTWNMFSLCVILPYIMIFIAQIFNVIPIVAIKYDIDLDEALDLMMKGFSYQGDYVEYIRARYWISHTETYISLMKFGVIVLCILKGISVYGYHNICLKVSRDEKVGLSVATSGLKFFIKAMGLFIWQAIFITLWSMVFLIPGIIASIRYSMSFFIMIDNPELSIRECVNRSKDMMLGKLWKYFCVQLTFIGWYFIYALLTILIANIFVPMYLSNFGYSMDVTLVDGFVVVIFTVIIYILSAGLETYRNTTNAHIYNDLINENIGIYS